MNELLTQYALGEGRIEPSTLRVDTTVVESNIHFPTDSSLLWDFWRVLYRLIKNARETFVALEDRFHPRKVKKLHLFITRYSSSPKKKRKYEVKRAKKQLIEQSDWSDRAFVAQQHFRAGIEGSISVLKRAFDLLLCRYRGFKSFVSHVGSAVFCHNLVLLTELPGT